MIPFRSRWRLRVSACCLGTLLVGAGWFTWMWRRDPMPLLDQGKAALGLVEAREFQGESPSGEPRRYLDLQLSGAPAGVLRAVVSLPRQPPGPLPVVVILGGLEAGRESLAYVPVHGPNALVGCDYPQGPPSWYEGTPLRELPAIREAALAVPERMARLVGWIRGQPWADPRRVSLLGYSFGAAFAPACTRLLETRDMGPFRLVMAFGGADLPGLFDANVQISPRLAQWGAGRALGVLVRPLEPSRHLPHLRTPALVMLGTRDAKVPRRYGRLMYDLHGGQKSLMELEAPHLDPGRPELTAQVVEASRAWLVAEGALNPIQE